MRYHIVRRMFSLLTVFRAFIEAQGGVLCVRAVDRTWKSDTWMHLKYH